MSEPTVIVTLTARENREDEARQFLVSLLDAVHAETGCRFYAVHQDVLDRRSFAIVERWASEEDLENHAGGPVIAAAMAGVDRLFADGPNPTTFEAVPGGEPGKGMLGPRA